MTTFTMSFPVRWADLDPNRHLRHSAFNDYGTHIRFSYLEEQGFGMEAYERLDFSPVILREEVRFLREVRQGDTITLDMRLVAGSPKLARFRLAHDVTRSDGVLAATIEVDGGWMSLSKRKLIEPPVELAEALRRVQPAEGFEELQDIGSSR
ncbi:MAG: acyl-CoA thioesterase [Thermoanaerobaculia bacterium]